MRCCAFVYVYAAVIRQPARRRGSHTHLQTARNAAIRIEISAKAPEGIGVEIDQSGKVENDYLLKFGVEVRCRKTQPVLKECLIDARIKGYRAIGFQTRISIHRVAKKLSNEVPNLSKSDGARYPLPTCPRIFVPDERNRYATDPSPV